MGQDFVDIQHYLICIKDPGAGYSTLNKIHAGYPVFTLFLGVWR